MVQPANAAQAPPVTNPRATVATHAPQTRECAPLPKQSRGGEGCSAGRLAGDSFINVNPRKAQKVWLPTSANIALC
jgi:hypothetical protein